ESLGVKPLVLEKPKVEVKTESELVSEILRILNLGEVTSYQDIITAAINYVDDENNKDSDNNRLVIKNLLDQLENKSEDEIEKCLEKWNKIVEKIDNNPKYRKSK